MWNAAMPGLDENWGRAAFYAGRFSDAIGPLERLLRSRPDDPHIRTALGISFFETGDYAACVRTLQPIQPQLKTTPDAERVYTAALSRVHNPR
jgi:predicted Zn-dependent protease